MVQGGQGWSGGLVSRGNVESIAAGIRNFGPRLG